MSAAPLSLADRLRRMPHRFDALHALRLVELGAERMGTDALPPAEPASVATRQGLVFAPAPIAAVEPGERPRLLAAFLGLTGPLGVLPQAFSELVARAARLRNRALPAFLDVFNGRLTALFLRAADKYRLALQVQRSLTPPPGGEPNAGIGNDPVSRSMLAVAGFGTPALRDRLAVPDEVMLYFAGLFGNRNRPAVALEAMLADVIGAPVSVEQFTGRWLPVEPSEQTAMNAGAPFTRLGVDAVAGARVWDPAAAFRVVVGPVGYGAMLELMPSGRKLAQIRDLVRAYAGPDLLFDVQVILRKEDVPELELGSATGPDAARLGWNAWARLLPALQDNRDIILDPDRLPAHAAKERT